MTHYKVSSLEPLSKECVNYIHSRTGEQVTLIDRNTCFQDNKIFQNIEILICRDRDLDDYIIGLCTNLKIIFVVSVGVEKLPFKKLKERDIYVANTKGISADIMSNYAIANILSWSCKLPLSFKNQSNRYWQPYQSTDTLKDKQLLIIGAGRTGQEIAKKAKVFQMNCVGIKKHPIEMVNFSKVLSLDKLDTVVGKADFIVCTIPITDRTKYMFNIDMFKKMKQTAVFINISRGNLLVQRDLIQALTKNIIKGAVLDVFEEEPLLNDSELWDIDNLIITPHSSGRLENYMYHAMEIFCDNILYYKSEAKLLTEVNLKDCY